MWAFRSLWDKGLLYEGFRVLAYCWRCETPLSNTETRMDDVYKDRQDPALTVWFELEDGRRILAWTTTPWTLPSNLGLAVGPDIDYAVMEEDGQQYLLAEARLDALRARARRRHPGRDREGIGAGRPALPTAVPVLRRPARRDRPRGLPGAGGRLRVHGRRHRRRPPVARARRGGPGGLQRQRHRDRRPDGRAGPVHGGDRAVGRHARLRRQPARDPGAQGRRPRRPPRDARPPLPALLALREAARVPGGVVVVRRGDARSGTAWSS